MNERYFLSDGEVNQSALIADSSPFRYKKYQFENFAKDFSYKREVCSPVCRVKINLKAQFYKLTNWKENGKKLVGLIKPNLVDPLFVYEDKDGSYKFFSVFKKNEKSIYMISVVEKIRNQYILKTNYQIFNKAKLVRVLNSACENLVYHRCFEVKRESVKSIKPESKALASPFCDTAKDTFNSNIISKNTEDKLNNILDIVKRNNFLEVQI